jgi:hypothetical protein
MSKVLGALDARRARNIEVLSRLKDRLRTSVTFRQSTERVRAVNLSVVPGALLDVCVRARVCACARVCVCACVPVRVV